MPVKQMRQMRLCSHMQPFCNPCVSHRRFPPQTQGHSDLFRIPFSPFAQLCLLPLQFPELLLNHSLGLCFSRLPNLLPVMLRPSLLVHLRQQFLTESFVPKAPTPQQRLELLSILLLAPQFHPPLEFSASGRAVSRNAVLSQ